MRIMPELLLQTGLPAPYVKPFVMYLEYVEQLETINNDTTDARLDEIVSNFKLLITTLQQLDFTKEINRDNVNNNNDDDDEDDNVEPSDDETNDDEPNERINDLVADDDDEDDDDKRNNEPKQPNWLIPKVLVSDRFSYYLNLIIFLVVENKRMKWKHRRQFATRHRSHRSRRDLQNKVNRFLFTLMQ